ncbi:P2Y purinoceptor 8-like [Polypterus senegalus]|uniref:P2Y purinoceptor 8-like n=1 Tax=Polypterus senegalus TaxID=55291 RepID=UPI0019641575|nr:P2Y purinoceptor 8-like [Polypterus senegalus]XP_039600703.1 P2Y purinoceptor 8-like [Polypterus senegalus]XP_039600704.1 P2Y purinoceptor 8-like [Polypterus senegalus]XP_039600705.1 P2Y purinoceptor 8-like [Polypterus senegalus]XP_039600706.1 P2Y purinoceptor 8-like [Polypterus senegalus]XP_039600707.1 P2Y purinoceptor 8-like [Polypterus senegalus]XP_039600708.1 P2Y purinoceptor 8-like [Polypterus senegalus]XP_039600709.1 P2Y purinoceptor 8-like [Polypterus senegalus]
MESNMTKTTILSSNVSTKSFDSDILQMITSPIMTIALPVIYLAVVIFSVPLNIVSLWILLFHTKKKSPTIIFTINLSLTDFLYSLSLPFQIVYHLSGNNWPFGDYACRISTIAFYGNMHCSILTTCAISLDRYWGIVKPLYTRHRRTVRSAIIACIFMWALVLLVNSLTMTNRLTVNVEQLGIVTCFDIIPKTMFSSPIYGYLYFLAHLLFFFIIPLIIFVICYSVIVKTLKNSPNTDIPDSKRQTVNLIAIILLCFSVCYVPHIILQIIHMVLMSQKKSIYVYYKLSLGLNSLICCFDPFIYYFASKDFRHKLHSEICGCSFMRFDESSTSRVSEMAHLKVQQS